jgi:hypothetical protein
VTQLLMVLSDGSTFSPLVGCKIVSVPSELHDDDVEQLLSDGDYTTVHEFTDENTHL